MKSPPPASIAALESGLTDCVWEIKEQIALLDQAEAEKITSGSMKHGIYKSKNADANG